MRERETGRRGRVLAEAEAKEQNRHSEVRGVGSADIPASMARGRTRTVP